MVSSGRKCDCFVCLMNLLEAVTCYFQAVEIMCLMCKCLSPDWQLLVRRELIVTRVEQSRYTFRGVPPEVVVDNLVRPQKAVALWDLA